MKTPLQELIEKFEYIKENNCHSLTEVVFFDAVIALTETFLEKEKQQIINAHEAGKDVLIMDSDFTDSRQYYNETYD